MSDPKNPSNLSNPARRAIIAYAISQLEKKACSIKVITKSPDIVESYEAFLARIGGCAYCGRPKEEIERDLQAKGRLGKNGVVVIAKDHILELGRDGGASDEEANLAPACEECNQEKKKAIYPTWQDFVKRSPQVKKERKDLVIKMLSERLSHLQFQRCYEHIQKRAEEFRDEIDSLLRKRRQEVASEVLSLFNDGEELKP